MSGSSCTAMRTEFLEALRDRMSPVTSAAVHAHLAECAACAEEFRALREVWHRLPSSADALPPSLLRDSLLARARQVAEQPEGVLRSFWAAVKGLVAPVGVGAAAAFGIVSLIHLRGAMAPLDHMGVVAAGLALAALIATVVGALWRSTASGRLRAILLGSVGALGGYLALTAVSPIPDTVQLCRVFLFHNGVMSTGEMCLVYLAVAMLYAGLPIGLAAYAWGGADSDWRSGLAEAAVFALLAAPTLLLQTGFGEWMITLTLLAGFVGGALAGGLAGTWARVRWLVGTTG